MSRTISFTYIYAVSYTHLNTRLVICTQASNVTGTILPIEALSRLCRQRGILFLVDGAQGAGHLPMEASGMDLLAVPGHKGLMGPLGTGFLYVRDGVDIKHVMEGGTGTASREILQPKELPEGYEAVSYTHLDVYKRQRLDLGIKLYQEGVAPKLLLSGDHGQVQYDEVNAMKEYALQEGVPEEDLFLDHAGFSTYDSVYRAKKVFQVERMVVVTQGYHLYRALYGCEKMGIKA